MVSAELATNHRAAVARVVYLAHDRLDWRVAAIELGKTMAISREGDDGRLKRVARYLHGHPGYLQWFPVQEETNTVVLSTDADCATCRETRRPNSGGTLQLGGPSHRRVESDSTTHCTGMRCISETLASVHLMREFKSNNWGRVVHRVDASACRAIMLRRGCGGLKHITVKSLWVQEAVREYSIEVDRVPGDVMHAHVLASPSRAEQLRKTPDTVECVQRWRGRGLTSGLRRWWWKVVPRRRRCLGRLIWAMLRAGQYWIVRNSCPVS